MNYDLDRSSHTPFYIQLKDIIEAMIKNNEFTGGKLWSESELSKEYDLTITTIRKSLQILKQEGKIYSVRGVGHFVQKPKVEFNLTKYLSIGRALREQGIEEKLKVLEKKDNVKVDDLLEENGIKSKQDKAIKIARLRHVGKNPIDYEEIYLNQKVCGSLIDEPFDKVIYNMFSDKLGINIGGLEEYIQAEMPTAKEVKLLGLKDNMPVLTISRVIKDTSGNWLEMAIFKIRSDMFKYTVSREGM